MEHRIIPSFIQELLEAGVEVSLTKDSFVVEGFYKSGNIEIKCRNESDWYAVARYQEKTDIETVEDIVGLNHAWWYISKERYDGWSQPDSRWLPLLVKYGYVTAKVIPEQIIYE